MDLQSDAAVANSKRFYCVAFLQELCSLREQNKELQSQTTGNSTALQEAAAKVSSLAADNQKLHDALNNLRNSQDQKVEELANLLSTNAELRREKVTLETEKQAAADKAEHWQRQYENQKKVGFLPAVPQAPILIKHCIWAREQQH